MNDARTDMDPQELVNIPPDLGKQFTEIFVKDPENVQLVLSFLSVIFASNEANTLLFYTVILYYYFLLFNDVPVLRHASSETDHSAVDSHAAK